MTVPRVLVVDNHDSYTFNLVHLIARVAGAEPTVLRHDEVDPGVVTAGGFTHVVISPGPGHPANARDFGRCRQVLRAATVPVLGVCLGHQGIADAFGGDVAEVTPAHGRVSRIRHDGAGLFAGIPQRFPAVRYHSLAVTRLPADLTPTAHSEDGVLMALRHRDRPLYGVQFHPESVLSGWGEVLVGNFLATAAGPPQGRVRASRAAPDADRSGPGAPPRPVAHRPGRPAPFHPAAGGSAAGVPTRPEVAPSAGRHHGPGGGPRVRALGWADPETVFVRGAAAAESAFWLDSNGPGDRAGRFSYLGWLDPDDLSVRYDVGAGRLVEHRSGATRDLSVDAFGYLAAAIRAEARPAGDLPFGFGGGWVGYFGYECKADTAGGLVHRADTPDACFLRVRRFLAFDHVERVVYAVSDDADAEARLDTLAAVVADASAPPAAPTGTPAVLLRTWSPDRYAHAFAAVQAELRRGNSYEVNVAYQTSFACEAPPLAVYRALRRENPAPYGAFLRHRDVAVLSSSPERFLSVDPVGGIEVRPIKGTTPRGATAAEDDRLRRLLADDPKFRAENLMISDLLRNDLSIVCTPGTVHVPELMAVESYASVHQLVTTIRGALRPGTEAVHAARALFPPGSMTGAPKKRTTEIIDAVEDTARGVYSGALGWFGLDGQADLSVVIRTLVARDGVYSLGAGGGVTVLSDVDSEWAETTWKAARLLRALARSTGQPVEPPEARWHAPGLADTCAAVPAEGAG